LIYDDAVDTASIARLLRPFAELSVTQLEQTATYLGLLLKWNAKVNLTAVRDPRQILTRHFGESFFAAQQLLVAGWSGSVIDFGSGAGFPGLPVAMFAPSAQVTLIESNAKKATFLNEVISFLELKNARVARQRAENYSGTATLVTMRAVEKFEAAIPVVLNLVQPGGRLALMIGTGQMGTAMRVAAELSWSQAVPVPQSHSRVLLVGTKQVNVGES
jgi:16S rRNA (guanine527-N7)-methyltransferase